MILEYFQLVDRVIEIDRDAKRVRCAATVPETSTIFEGHFPGHPLMPGTLLVESMAQTSGYLLLSLQDFERLPFLIQIEKAKIRTFVEPGTELTVEGELVHEGSGFAVTRASVKSTKEGQKIAEADLRFRTMPFPTDELKETVKTYAAAVGAA
jgi:3-hydroxyacyl-[acyl-carrier-protein] dehydratase